MTEAEPTFSDLLTDSLRRRFPGAEVFVTGTASVIVNPVDAPHLDIDAGTVEWATWGKRPHEVRAGIDRFLDGIAGATTGRGDGAHRAVPWELFRPSVRPAEIL